MKLADIIGAAEEPLDVALPLDDIAEMQEHFGIFTVIDSEQIS